MKKATLVVAVRDNVFIPAIRANTSLGPITLAYRFGYDSYERARRIHSSLFGDQRFIFYSNVTFTHFTDLWRYNSVRKHPAIPGVHEVIFDPSYSIYSPFVAHA